MNFNQECWYRECCKKVDTEDCTKACVRYLEMRTMLEKSELPKAWWVPQPLVAEKDFIAYERLMQIKKDIDTFVSEGRNIYIYSKNYGNGKTSWAVKLLLAYFNKVWYGNGFRCKGLYINSAGFLMRKKGLITKIDEEYLAMTKTLETVNLAVWDDIAINKLSDYDYQTLSTMIDTRMFNRKSNIFTGDADKRELEYCLGSKLANTIWNNSEIIEFKNPDMRGVL